ncbi:MAG: Eco57I restriction-modification methylase domain-containing protein [Chloroflexota bacterium]|nr:Eco57I restriction-modification methylase domain-containing protein [Chloroflexota bacterium]
MAGTRVDTHQAIRDALASAAEGDFADQAAVLLDVLGYRSDRTLPGQTGSVDYFLEQFPATNLGTQSEARFREAAESIQVLFQITDEEIGATDGNLPLFPNDGFQVGNVESFLFTAVELLDDSYTRGCYATFTREINKRFPAIPAVVIFRTSSGRLTLAFVHVRPNKRNPERNVIGSVSLIREIAPIEPHRAHLDILDELRLEERLHWMDQHGRPRNFDGLLAAWLDALDTEELNRRFYKDLFTWFEHAVDSARFPTDQPRTLSPEEHVIRLITRMLFVWFIKEKRLIAEELFVEPQVAELLRGYDRGGDSYYRAVLQNLFFATLNTEIDGRRFSRQTNTTHRNFSRYRYKSEIADPDALLALFAETPFINGGLFDCLDSEEAGRDGGYRIDCFTDNVVRKRADEYEILSIPNWLFFGNEGLIDLFNHYKFTVEENTPAEQEVALDPELLGKVFENLLAAYNPETQRTARKQTGSYYTPRPVVDYMVEEALVASLVGKVESASAESDWWEARLRYLLDYNDAFEDAAELFAEDESAEVIRAIAELKVLDPAVGSGAFPMGVLNKLTLALSRLDPRNARWEELQKDLAGKRAKAAFDTRDQQERDAELAEISATFERYRGSDFGRKLYLIQSSIYGVDIQAVATQIAKLRFFISLAIEQEPTDDRQDNYGVKPLPNLETRFVAADALLGLERPPQMSFAQTGAVAACQQRLNENRERHFNATTRSEKLACRQEDAVLRAQLAVALKESDFPAADAEEIARWDPYDLNASAPWFDPVYMFGVEGGFDVVIGNPPYRQVPKGQYSFRQFPYSEGKDKGKQNLYKLFVEQSYNLAKYEGLATLIVQSSLMCDLSSSFTRKLLLERTQLKHIIEFPKAAATRSAQLFQSVTQGTCIFQFKRALPGNQPILISAGNDAHSIYDLQFAPITADTIMELYPDLYCLPHIKEGSASILKRIAENDSIKPLRCYASSIVQGDLNLTGHSAHFSYRPTGIRLLRGRNIGRFVIRYADSTEYCDEGFMHDKMMANRRGVFLISQEVTGTNDVRRLHFGLADCLPTDYLCGHSTNKTQLKNPENSRAYLALLNSKFMDWFFRMTSTNNHVQGYELEQLPIPTLAASERRRLDCLARHIVAVKEANAAADTAVLEAEIDRRVYSLFGLDDDEIVVVEGR